VRKCFLPVLAGCVVATSAFATPQPIESFEDPEFAAIQPAGCAAERTQDQVSDGQWSLKVDFAGSENDTWPGLTVKLPGGDIERGELLAFDVYNPMPEPVGLSYRIDRTDGATEFGGENIPAKAWQTVRIWLASGFDGVARIDRVFPYIRMPRQNYTLYFDHFRTETSTERFQRIAYVELAQPPEPTPAELEFGGLVFARGPLAHVFQNSLPWPGERIDSSSCVAARGETEPLTVSVHALRSLDGLTLETTALECEQGALPADAIQVGRVSCLDKKTTYSSNDYIAGLPTYVEPRNVFETLPEGTSCTFWLSVRVPAGAAEGVYHCDALLKAGGRTFSLPVRVRVLPFTLPEAEGYFIGEYYRAWGCEKGDAGIARLREDLLDMRSRGMTSVGLCFGLDTEKTVLQDGKIALGFDGSSQFEQFMNLYRDLGFPMPVLILADSGQSVALQAGPCGTPEHDAAYIAFWRAMQDACKERGWPEFIVQPVDEPAWQGQEERDRNVYYLRLLKQLPGMRTEIDGPGDAYFHELAGPHADVWNYNGAVAPFDKLEEYKRSHIITLYNNDVEGYRPEVQRYVLGIFQVAARINGAYNWEYRGGSNDLYNDFDGENGDFVHLYLPQGDSLGGPSLGWEGAREGVDDLRYLILLETWIAKAREARPDAPAIRAAEDLLSYLAASVEASPAVRGCASWTFSAAKDQAGFKTSDAEADLVIGGVLKQPNGWSLRDYARARSAIACAICNLMFAVDTNTVLAEPQLARGRRLEFLGLTPFPEQAATEAGAQQAGPDAEPVSRAGLLELRQGPALALPFDLLDLDIAWKGNSELLYGAKVHVELSDGQETSVEPVVFPAPASTRFAAAIRFDYAPLGESTLILRLVDANGNKAGRAEHRLRVFPAL